MILLSKIRLSLHAKHSTKAWIIVVSPESEFLERLETSDNCGECLELFDPFDKCKNIGKIMGGGASHKILAFLDGGHVFPPKVADGLVLKNFSVADCDIRFASSYSFDWNTWIDFESL